MLCEYFWKTNIMTLVVAPTNRQSGEKRGGKKG